LEIFKNTQEVLVIANTDRASFIWWTYYFGPGLSNSSFYLYNIL